MITDTEIKSQGMKFLVKNLGIVEAERFIALIQREPFDYTQWKQNHWTEKTVKEIHKEAVEFRKKKRGILKKKVGK